MAYLHRYPDDTEVSDIWLQKADLEKLCIHENDDLAFKISAAQPENKHLQRMLARTCLLAERIDYPALKAYRRIIEDPMPDDRDIVDSIAAQFFKDRRADRWAIHAFLLAFKADRKKTWLLKGMAACMQRSSASDRASHPYREVDRLLSKLDKETLAKMGQAFLASPLPRAKAKALPRKDFLKTAWPSLASASSSLAAMTLSATTAVGEGRHHPLSNHQKPQADTNSFEMDSPGSGRSRPGHFDDQHRRALDSNQGTAADRADA
jgi:hypothetical protein